MTRNTLTSGRLFSLNPAIFLLPKALLGFPIGYALSTLRRGWAVGTVLGLGAILAGRNLMGGADVWQWAGDAAFLGVTATYGYLRARSLRREAEGKNPFDTQPDMTFPKRVAMTKGVVSNLQVSMMREGTQRHIINRETEGDGFPRTFNWSVRTERGFSLRQRLFYQVFDPHRFTFSMGRFARSGISRLLVRPFAWWKGINTERFRGHQEFEQYRSFDEFFTRRLNRLPDFYLGAAPAEGRLVYMGRGDMEQVLTIKGERISLRDLLGEKAAGLFTSPVGVLVTYLSPRDYHLSHSPVDGKVIGHLRIPGAAWTVGPEIWNERNIEGRPGAHYLTFNTRDVLLKETAYGPFATVYVAATNVYSTEIHPPIGREVKAGMHEQSYHFGSTNVYVFQADQFYFPQGMYPGQQFIFGLTPFLIPRSEMPAKQTFPLNLRPTPTPKKK